jgi:hypothetical protein
MGEVEEHAHELRPGRVGEIEHKVAVDVAHIEEEEGAEARLSAE